MKCPNCGKELDGDIKISKSMSCLDCGLIMSLEGLIVYKFKDIGYVYRVPISDTLDVEDFKKYISENQDEYEYAKVIDGEGNETILV